MSKKVLVVDDSALVRKSLAELIGADPDLELMGTANDPYFAAEKIKQEIPDVITLDVEMPRMDGITFLRTLMSQFPIPVVILSSLTKGGTETALQALRYGAVDVISKPKMHGLDTEIEESRIRLLEAIKGAAHATVGRRSGLKKSTTCDNVVADPTPLASMAKTSENIIVIGASTGGTEALRTILNKLPANAPAVAVVQHMPEDFTRSFAESLNSTCKVVVKEAADGDFLVRGTVLIAPGNRHMIVKRSGARYIVVLKDGPLVNRHRPSVDVLFRSAANYAGKNSKGILLTGMGKDGAQGMVDLKNAGAATIAQDEQSCVVFGMPKEAINTGAVDRVLPLSNIHKAIC